MYQYKARYLNNYDGDTCVLAIDLGFGIALEQTVRLNGIDCAELKTGDRKAAGKAAKVWLESKLSGARLTVTTYKPGRGSNDKYGRILADLTVLGEEMTVNQQMIEAGLAVAYDGGKRGG